MGISSTYLCQETPLITLGYITYSNAASRGDASKAVPPPEWSQRVATLRDALGLKQVDFARMFGVTQAAVSRWESGTKEPSVENYIRMGNMAPMPHCLWFWKKAGVDMERVEQVLLVQKKDRIS